MKFRTWSDSVDPDTSCWRESGEDKVYFLMVLRIFLEVGVGEVNRIGTCSKTSRLQSLIRTVNKCYWWLVESHLSGCCCLFNQKLWDGGYDL